MMFQAFENKMNDVVEKRDRILTQQLNRSFGRKAIRNRSNTGRARKKRKERGLFCSFIW